MQKNWVAFHKSRRISIKLGKIPKPTKKNPQKVIGQKFNKTSQSINILTTISQNKHPTIIVYNRNMIHDGKI